MNGPTAKVICDSISPYGVRLTTLEVKYHRFVLAEMNTHRAFSRNTASSRAIPYMKMRESVMLNPALPLSWPQEQRGMQGGQELSVAAIIGAENQWLKARDLTVETADRLYKLGLHKSVINRLLEPFQYVTSIITATDWQGFFDQRDSELAQPEIRGAARAMREAYENSSPQRVAREGWHLPYITSDDFQEAYERHYDTKKQASVFKRISAARCARVSYLTHAGRRDWNADLDLYNRLVTAYPPHWSPLEHVATPGHDPTLGNFRGWQQLRHLISKRDVSDAEDLLRY